MDDDSERFKLGRPQQIILVIGYLTLLIVAFGLYTEDIGGVSTDDAFQLVAKERQVGRTIYENGLIVYDQAMYIHNDSDSYFYKVVLLNKDGSSWVYDVGKYKIFKPVVQIYGFYFNNTKRMPLENPLLKPTHKGSEVGVV